MAIIDNGLEAVVMRNKMESKDALAAKGSLYVGTGGQTIVTTSSNTTVSIPELQHSIHLTQMVEL